MGFVTVSAIVLLFLQIFQCIPIEANWEAWKGKDVFESEYTCLNINVLAYVAASVSIAQDIIILALPLPPLWALKVSSRSKTGIMIMFSLGVFILITSCIRLRFIVLFANSQNPTWDYADSLIWSGLEVSVSVIVTSLPAVRVLLNRVLPNILGTVATNSRKSSGGASARGSGYLQSSGSRMTKATQPLSTIFSIPSRKGDDEFNESQLELGGRIHGNVQTEIGAADPTELRSTSSTESGIYAETILTTRFAGEGRAG
jgi:hypothetical protein